MTQYARSKAAQTLIVQSADAADLEARVNAVIDSLTAGANPDEILGITLAGAGDGHTFVVLIDHAPLNDANGNLQVFGNALSPTFATRVRCYLAGDADELLAAQAKNPGPAPYSGTIPYTLADVQVAGAAKGTRFMGLSVYTLEVVPLGGISAWTLAAQTAGAQALTAATPHIVTFDSLSSNSAFELVSAGQGVHYRGSQGVQVGIKAALAFSVVAPGTYTAEIVTDPAGTPTVIGALTGPVTADQAVPVFATVTLVASPPAAATLGLRITTSANGSLVSSQMLVEPIG